MGSATDIISGVTSVSLIDKLIAECKKNIDQRIKDQKESDEKNAEADRKYKNLLKEKKAFISEVKRLQSQKNDIDISLALEFKFNAQELIEDIGNRYLYENNKCNFNITSIDESFRKKYVLAENKKLTKRQFDFIKKTVSAHIDTACSEILLLAPISVRNSIKQGVAKMTRHFIKTKAFADQYLVERVDSFNLLYENGLGFYTLKIAKGKDQNEQEIVREFSSTLNFYDKEEVYDYIVLLNDKKEKIKPFKVKEVDESKQAEEIEAIQEKYDGLKKEFLSLKKEMTQFFAKPFTFNLDFKFKYNLKYKGCITDVDEDYSNEDYEFTINCSEVEVKDNKHKIAAKMIKTEIGNCFNYYDDEMKKILSEDLYNKNKELEEKFNKLSNMHDDVDWYEVHSF